jgi:prepilin-type N-terminal cleavage/methylation domain-containing protein/prepilin-type processing-associated H-X9-DG protein
MKRTPSAFTLIELLVVISIIAMLASLMMPAIRSGLEQAKKAKCMSNLTQIGNAVQQYIADPENGHRYPPIYNANASFNSNTLANTNISAGEALKPLNVLANYGVTLALLTCPSDRAPDTNYGSYIWSPIVQEEQPEDVHIYTPGGVFTVQKLSRLTVCTDNGRPHRGKFNVLRADGHVDSKP